MRWHLPDLPSALARVGPARLEIGCGKGDFLCALARAHPGEQCLGIEIRHKRADAIARRIEGERLANAAVVLADASEALAGWIPTASISAVYLNFPDPWPKGRHADRRLLGPLDRHELARVLLPGGTLTYATDVRERMEEACEGMAAEGWRVEEPPGGRPDGYPVSIHEGKFRAWGRPIRFRRFTRPC